MIPTFLFALLLAQAAPAQPAGTMAPIPDEGEEAPPAYQLGSGPPGYRIAPEAVPALPRLEATGVTIENYDRRVEARFGTPDPFYEAVVRGGAAAAQGRQGALDGGWTLFGPGGTGLYALQLVDTGEGASLEGAWRDLRSDGTRDLGLIALIAREPGRTVLRFFEPGAPAPTVVTLAPFADGTWRGELARPRAGSGPLAVVMRRRAPSP